MADSSVTGQPVILSWSSTPEGPFFERKSAYDRSGPRAKPRKLPEVAWDIAETLSAMANADGGEMVIGIENDGTPTGVPLPEAKIQQLLRVPTDRNYVSPALRCQQQVVQTQAGKHLLCFSVEWSPEVHRLNDGRYLLRTGESNTPFPADQIAALKRTKSQGLYERHFPPGASLESLDMELVASALSKARLEMSPEDFLRRFRLVEGRNGRAVPSMAGLLLFAKDPTRWHPRCGIDFVRWEGSERKHGADLNISKRIAIEHPLAALPEMAYEAIRPFIRERQKLHDLFFTERMEYPTSAWQEAVVNAVAHRDYSIQGAPSEIWMFDDRIEIRSPGLPPQPVTIEALNRREHIHISRNPLIVRVLSALGYMRELGEGIPRMFEEMEREGFYPPGFEAVGDTSFQVTLRNQPVHDDKTLGWLAKFKDFTLTGDQKRLLASVHKAGNRFTSKDFQKLAGLDLYAASNAIKDLIRKGIVHPLQKGSRIYEVREPLEPRPEMPEAIRRLLSLLQRKPEIANEDIRDALQVSRPTAARVAKRLCEEGWLERLGAKRWTRYRLAPGRMDHPPHVS